MLIIALVLSCVVCAACTEKPETLPDSTKILLNKIKNLSAVSDKPHIGRENAEILSDQLISDINKHKAWVAGHNFPVSIKVEELKNLGGYLGLTPKGVTMDVAKVTVYDLRRVQIPTRFDAREKWPHCKSLFEIRDQGQCAACWAFAAAEAMSDRLCIHSNGTHNVEFSPVDLMACCKNCGDCKGGYMWSTFSYYVRHGVVSGGDYGSNKGCMPYSARPFLEKKDPICTKRCRENYTEEYQRDKLYGQRHYQLPNSERQIQREIMLNGPLVVNFQMYADFFTYKSGVYRHLEGKYVVEHVGKILGWGLEGNQKYWLLANSWNSSWGDKGFFKFLRGSNECGIENYANAALPRL